VKPDWDKRAENRDSSKQMLSDKGIQFTEHNNGAHLKVGRIDFWPGTGLWKDGNFEDRGVKNLIAYIKSKERKGESFTVTNAKHECPHCGKKIIVTLQRRNK